MSSGVLKRSERHLLVGSLLRIRAVVYAMAGVPILLAAPMAPVVRIAGVALAVLAVGVPFIVRRTSRYAGARTSAGIDLAVSYLIWFAVPWAGGMSLFFALGAIATVEFLSPAKSATKATFAAILLELSKIGVVAAGFGVDGAGLSVAAEVGISLARASAISASHFLFRGIDRYLLRLAAAAETGSERYRRLMDGTPTGYVVVVGSEIDYMNEAAEQLLCQTAARATGSSLVGLVAHEDQVRLGEAIDNALDRLDSVTVENLLLRIEDQDDRWIDATCTMIDYGSDLAVQISLHDRSGQRRAEIDLHRTEVDYGEFFERIPVALYRSQPDGRITQANAALVELLGGTSDTDLVALDAKDFYVDMADREHLTKMLKDSDIVVGFETRLRKIDGQTIWVRDTSRRIETDEGIVYEGAMVDITGRRAIEDELWSRAAQQEAAATIGQIALDSDDIAGAFREITDLVSRVLGTDGVVLLRRSADGVFAFVGAPPIDDLTPESVASVADRAHMTTAPVVLRNEVEVNFTAPGLSDHGIQACAAVMIPGAETDFGTLIALTEQERFFTQDDINFLLAVGNVLAAAIDRSNARARMEDLLRSKDEFVASVSHELRTPLTVVTGMAHELNERWMDLTDDELREFTEMLVEQSRDMSDLIEDLLVAARSNIGNVAVLHDCVAIEREIESVIAGFPDTGSAMITTDVVPGKVTGDPIRVRQILRNLLTNALRYGGPNIEISTSLVSGSLAIDVSDDGEGIPPEDHERIFAAYERAHFSEGQPGSVGLGLTVSRTLAELMNGSLTYRFDGRSTFRLELPRAAGGGQDGAANAGARDDDLSRAMRPVGAGRIGVDVGM